MNFRAAAKKTERLEWAHIINYGTFLAFAGLFIFLELTVGESPQSNFLVYYTKAFFDPAKGSLLWVPLTILVYFLLRFVVLFTTGAIKLKTPTWKNLFLGKGGARSLVEAAKTFAAFGLPAILALFALTLVFGHVNALNSNHLKDDLLLSWDKTLAGTYPFLAWGNASYPKWFFDAVIFSFGALPALLLLFGFYLAHEHGKLFKEFTAAFSLAFLIMLPVWLKLPVLSPQDRFIDNVYGLSVSAEIEPDLKDYRPQQKLREFFASVREQKSDLGGAMPTSTFPSAHVAWATLLIIYAWRAVKKIGLVLLPIATLSTFGTVLLAQHYFVDIPAGIAVAVASAAIVRIAIKKQG